MKTKLDRALHRYRIPTTKLIAATQHADPAGKGYSRTYLYGIRRGEIDNPTRQCMAIVLAAVRRLSGDRRLQLSDLFDLEQTRRKAS